MSSRHGCRRHATAGEQVTSRWLSVEATIDAADPDDFDAQSDAIGMCHCCGGPTKDLQRSLCSRCSGGCGVDKCLCTPMQLRY